MKLNHDDMLFHRGSLLSEDGLITASYDLEQDIEIGADYSALSPATGVANACVQPILVDYSTAETVHIINGMGVALGDSIIGLTAIYALRQRHPGLQVFIYRPSKVPDYVEQLYQLAEGMMVQRRTLPYPLQALAAERLKIDIGNHVFWPAFAHLPMIDFFLQALGLDPVAIPGTLKQNGWLQNIRLPALPAPWNGKQYVLFCPQASTPIRSIPQTTHVAWVEMLWQKYALPVLGFGDVTHPHYVDIRGLSDSTAHFLAWIKHATAVLTCDSAAVHAAAGFNIPTWAFFTSISPELRTRDYPHCRSIRVNVPEIANLHSSAQVSHVARVNEAYQCLLKNPPLF